MAEIVINMTICQKTKNIKILTIVFHHRLPIAAYTVIIQ